ncbi:hypothetical protein DIS24_g7780 [Lasiodiplodia hormozganensis]|uniref:Uncharacterized protein n=1 Tax=Lasiodiplodia hormozganensis TaxID=869390 RepID=A0AA40CQI6_9PEZI|nr:hypothetical protein DIS24_g7780 [Lasiodiplodia hormozganensis]
MRKRLRLAFNFWRSAGCELCTAYRDYAAADTHDMEQCQNWEEAPQAQRILQLLEEMSVRVRPVEDPTPADGSPCKACSFLSQRCRSNSPRLTARDGTVADCENIEVARRAVAALLSFEDGLLADVLLLRKAEWVKTGDPAAMQAWMALQKFAGGSPPLSVPQILRALDHLSGSHAYLLADHEYRSELRPRGKKQETAVAALPPRCSDEPVGLLIDAMDAELPVKEQRLSLLEGLLWENSDTQRRVRDSRCTVRDLRRRRWQDDGLTERIMRVSGVCLEYDRLKSDIETIRDMKPIFLHLREIEPRLLRFRDVCMVCRAMGKPSDHNIRVCTNEMARKARAELVRVDKAANFDLHLGCHRCGMPKLICSRWAKQKGEVNLRLMRVPGRCSFEGVALETIYGIKYGMLGSAVWTKRIFHGGYATTYSVNTLASRDGNPGALPAICSGNFSG